MIRSKATHDIVGHYNRFDVFSLEIDRRAHEPLTVRNGYGRESLVGRRGSSGSGPADVDPALDVLESAVEDGELTGQQRRDAVERTLELLE